MSARPTTEPNIAGIAAGAAICAGAAILLVAATALAVVLSGLDADTRTLLRFGFGGVERTAGEALRIALDNARLAGATLLAAAIVPRLPGWARRLVDALLAALLSLNAGAVGLALGAYGRRVAAATALHLPLEFAALSLAGGAYISSSKRPIDVRMLAGIATLCASLLALAATLETYVALGGVR